MKRISEASCSCWWRLFVIDHYFAGAHFVMSGSFLTNSVMICVAGDVKVFASVRQNFHFPTPFCRLLIFISRRQRKKLTAHITLNKIQHFTESHSVSETLKIFPLYNKQGDSVHPCLSPLFIPVEF